MDRKTAWKVHQELDIRIARLSNGIDPLVLFDLAVKAAMDMDEFALGSRDDSGFLEMMMRCEECDGFASVNTDVAFPWEDEDGGLDWEEPEMLAVFEKYGNGQSQLVKGVNFAACVCGMEDDDNVDAECGWEEEMNILFREKFIEALNDFHGSGRNRPIVAEGDGAAAKVPAEHSESGLTEKEMLWIAIDVAWGSSRDEVWFHWTRDGGLGFILRCENEADGDGGWHFLYSNLVGEGGMPQDLKSRLDDDGLWVNNVRLREFKADECSCSRQRRDSGRSDSSDLEARDSTYVSRIQAQFLDAVAAALQTAAVLKVEGKPYLPDWAPGW